MLGGAALALGLALVGALRATGQAGAGSARALDRGAAPVPQEPLTELLSGIDFVPDRGALDGLMGDSAPAELISIARGRDANLVDAGLRIRAYRALALYPSPDIAAVLHTAVAEHGAAARGVDTLYVRAAMESLALVDPDAAVASLEPMLAHASQDVRACAAHALGATGSRDAVPILHTRLPVEPVLQVQLAIADALRRLSNASEGTLESGPGGPGG